ncbi:hypothetical protein PoB_004117800 [Plakobranchus ocellatus]|uniref:Uncharacterized protein n=1 Tax=Plakobranchus ocellatus TaxID=259542 RepID=A0AAV4B6E6_9GAST|nr:hypothetical protein PoB_004117800 [Plakobranchus ocellatus]
MHFPLKQLERERNLSEELFDMSDNSRSERPLTASGDAGVAAGQQSLAVDKGLFEGIIEDVLISKSSVHKVLTDIFDKEKMFSNGFLIC